MPSSFTASGRFTLQATGENNNTWGAILNAGVFQLVDDAINGHLGLAVSGNVTLATANGAPDQQRMHFLDMTSGSGGQVEIGASPKAYFARNGAAGPVFLTAGGVQGPVLNPGDAGPLHSDGANIYGLQLDGVDLRAYIASRVSGGGNLPSPLGGVNRALVVRNTGIGEAWVPDFLDNASLRPGTALANLGYTPANVAGQVFTGGIQAPSVGLSGTRFQLYALGAGGGVSQIAWDSIAGIYETVDWTTGLWSFVHAGTPLSTLDINGNVTFAGTLAAASISGATLANGSVTAAKLAPGAAVGNIGYTPANLAGDTFTGPVTVPSLNVKSTEFQLATDNASYSQINLRTSANYFLQYDWAAHNLKYVANGVQVMFIDIAGNVQHNGNGVFGGTLSYHTSLSAISTLAGGILQNYTLDGFLRWIQGANPGTGDMQFNVYSAAGAYVATPLRLGLADSSVNIGPNSTSYFTRNGQGVWWQNGSAVHMTGDQPAVTFNHLAGGNKIAVGQTASGRVLTFAKGDSTPANFTFDLNSGIGTATTWTSTSDRRLKFDLKPLIHGLDVLAALSPFTFGQAQTEADAQAKQGTRSAGLIAQDLIGTPFERLLVAPTEDRSFYALDYTALAAWYVAAFKEVKARLEDLQARVEALEAP